MRQAGIEPATCGLEGRSAFIRATFQVDGVELFNIREKKGAENEMRVVQRQDASWLADASLTMDEFWKSLGLEERRSDSRQNYHTLGGLVVTELGRIPKTGDAFEALELRFEVVDMDGHRVDKVLVSPVRMRRAT